MTETAPRLRDLLMRGAARLRASGSETPELDASLLLAHLLGIDRAALYARTMESTPADLGRAFDAMIARRAAHVPIAYLLGGKEFMGLPFVVTPAVLVPRPETELLVEWAVRWINAGAGSVRVVDVGTGSGAIAVSVAHAALNAHVVASDISREALYVARGNAGRGGVGNRVAFVCGGLLAWLGGSVDLVLANLPYLTDDERASPALSGEPRLALAGGDDDGFALYRALIPQVARHLALGGAFAFEIGPAQADVAGAICARAFPDATITVHDDLAGLARVVTVETRG